MYYFIRIKCVVFMVIKDKRVLFLMDNYLNIVFFFLIFVIIYVLNNGWVYINSKEESFLGI